MAGKSFSISHLSLEDSAWNEIQVSPSKTLDKLARLHFKLDSTYDK